MPWRFTKYRPGPDTRWPTGPAQPLLRLARARASTGCISDVRLSAGDGTDGSNPICSSGESVANRFPRWVQRPLILPQISTASCRAGMPTRRPGGIKASVTQLIQELIPEGRQRAEEHQRGQASGSGVRGRAPRRLAGQLFFGVRRAVEVNGVGTQHRCCGPGMPSSRLFHSGRWVGGIAMAGFYPFAVVA